MYEINTTLRLDIICAYNSGLSAFSFPSWVPDGTAPSAKDYILGLCHRDPAKTHATGLRYADVKWSNNVDFLYARGFCFDTANALGEPCKEDRDSSIRVYHVLETSQDWRKLYITAKGKGTKTRLIVEG